MSKIKIEVNFPTSARENKISSAMKLHFFGLIIFNSLLWHEIHSHQHYAFEIPNGNNVFHNNQLINAIGHVSRHGHGPLNAFGMDFMKEGHKWTEKLCRTDSDQDGRSNGMELGDVNCTWKRITNDDYYPPINNDIVLTHPGISNENNWPKLKEVEIHPHLIEGEGLEEDEDEDDEESDDWDGESFDDED